MKRLHLIIYGHVQGVFFRANAKEEAEKLGLVGSVWNAPDGTLVIQAEGEQTALRVLLDWCAKGTPLARVERIEEMWEDVETKSREGFEIVG